MTALYKKILPILLLTAVLALCSPLAAQTPRDDSPELLYSDFYRRALCLEPLDAESELSPYLSHLWLANLADSTQASALSDIGFVLSQLGQPEQAQTYLMRAYRASHGDHLIGEPLARMALANQDFATAEEVITELLVRVPDDHFLLILLQQAYRSEEKWDKAIEVGKKIVELSRDDPRQVSGLAGLYMQAGQQDKAVELLEEYGKTHPGEPSTQTVLFYLYLSAGDYDRAGKALEQLRKQDKGSDVVRVAEVTYLARRERYRDGAKYILSESRSEGIDPEQVESLIQTLYKESPSATEARREMVRVRPDIAKLFPQTPQLRLGLSQDYLLLGDTVAAEGILDRLVDDRVELVSPYVYFTDRYAAAEDTTNLRHYAEAGHEALPEEGVFRLYLALLAVNAGDTTGYRRQLDDALTVVSTEDRFYPQLALLRADDLSGGGDFEAARPYYEAAVSQPLPPAYNNYAYFLTEKSGTPADLDKAEKLARQAIKLEPDNGTYLDTYAWVLYRKGSSMLALIYIKKAIEATETPDPTLYEHLAEILTAEDRYDEAIEAWRHCLESGGDAKLVAQKVEAITEMKKKKAEPATD
ncbi:tetratricopeptide repeat protein [uncultured Porphyromonas sp.]|uniref:tetratricopeptide repeat protein n=1 Tax=uncultured Porphyromonas sp. TaxID=159274 RepID=UPI00259AD1AF|nr:tetratricopeptide repeat protein [uncultured Porphyromonas sp.]